MFCEQVVPCTPQPTTHTIGQTGLLPDPGGTTNTEPGAEKLGKGESGYLSGPSEAALGSPLFTASQRPDARDYSCCWLMQGSGGFVRGSVLNQPKKQDPRNHTIGQTGLLPIRVGPQIRNRERRSCEKAKATIWVVHGESLSGTTLFTASQRPDACYYSRCWLMQGSGDLRGFPLCHAKN